MAIFHFNALSLKGIWRDPPAFQLPASANDFAWSDGQNVRFYMGRVEKMLGDSIYVTSSVTVQYAFGETEHDLGAGARGPIWWFGKTDELRRHFFAQNTVIPISVSTLGFRTDASVFGGWPSAAYINSHFVWGHRFRAPMMVSNNSTQATYLTYNSAGSTWNDFGSAGGQARIMRRFGNHLIAIDVQDDTSEQNNIVWWSTDAGNDDVPATWDQTNTTERAGQTQIEGGGRMVDFFLLRDAGMIYKETAVWIMRQIGGNQVFRFDRLFSSRGMIARDCCAVLEDKHVVFGTDDIYIHDGVRYESILEESQRRTIFDNINRSAFRPAQVALNQGFSEVWIAYADGSNNTPNKLLAYNYKTGAVGERDVSGTWMTNGVVAIAGLTASTNQSYSDRVVFGADGALLVTDSTFQLNGTVMRSYVQRKGLDFEAPDRVKLCTRLWPRVTTTSGSIQVRVGSHSAPDGTVTWSGYKAFDPTTDEELDFNVRGRFLAVEFFTSVDANWTLTGFSMDVEDVGEF